jgi:hypothetical protein
MRVVPRLTHASPTALIRRERRLPVPGNITVRVNKRVKAMDVVAEAEVANRYTFVDIARSLGIPQDRVQEVLVRDVGDRVDAGDVIAGPVGLARRSARAPAKGRIVHLADGRALLQLSGRRVQILAGFPGVVAASDGVQTVTIETEGALIQGVWGNGKQGIGMMNLVGQGPGGRLQTDLLDINLRAAVLVAGICDHPAPLHQATELKARGLIVGGLSSELIPVARRLPYPVIVLGGFGEIPFDDRTFEILQEHLGEEAAIDARPKRPFSRNRPEVIIHDPMGLEAELPDPIVPLAAGETVRVLRRPHMGRVGLVRELQPYGTVFPSGIMARCAKVDLEGIGVREIPLSNLEIIK